MHGFIRFLKKHAEDIKLLIFVIVVSYVYGNIIFAKVLGDVLFPLLVSNFPTLV